MTPICRGDKFLDCLVYAVFVFLIIVALSFAGAAFAVVKKGKERSQIAFDAWNRIHPEMRLTRAEFDALSNKRMLNLNKSD